MNDTFPQFNSLQKEHHFEVSKIVNEFDPYSDFNFVSLYSWNTNENTQISILNNNLIIKLKDYTGDHDIYSFIGINKIEETVEILLDYLLKNNLKASLNLVPHVSVERLINSNDAERYQIVEDINQHDYIFSTEKILKLKNNEYMKKRNKISNFHKNIDEPPVVRLMNPSDQNDVKMITELTHIWSKNKINENKQVNSDEIRGLNRVLHFKDYNKMVWIGVFVKNKLIGFSVNEIINDDYAIVHFEKADKEYYGSGEYLIHKTAAYLFEIGIKYINFEQDLGLEGLRVTKQSWRPVKFLKKYTISPKQV